MKPFGKDPGKMLKGTGEKRCQLENCNASIIYFGDFKYRRSYCM